MGAPSKTANIGEFIRYNVRSIARIEADPVTAHVAKEMQQPHDVFMATLTARNQAENVLLKAQAKDDYARDKALDLIGPYALQVAAHFGAKDHPEVQRIVPLTVAQYGALKGSKQVEALDKVVEAIDDAATPAPLKKLGKPLVDAVAAWATQRKETAKVETAFKKAAKAVQDAKGPCLLGNAKARNQLGLLFPLQPKKVARYFHRKEPRERSEAPVAVEGKVARDGNGAAEGKIERGGKPGEK